MLDTARDGSAPWSVAELRQRLDDAVEPPREIDVCVVGAGYTGLNAALTLAEHGRSVLVLDRDVLASASSRNFGSAAVGDRGYFQSIRDRHGLETAQRAMHIGRRAVELVRAVVEHHSIACDLRQTGILRLAESTTTLEQLIADAETRVPGEATVLAAEELAELVDSSSFCGALVEPRAWTLDPARYLAGLVAACRQRGVIVCDGCEARSIARCAAGARVEHRYGHTSCATVVVAVNGAPVEGAPSPLEPRRIWTYVVATEPLSGDACDRVSRRRHTCTTSSHPGEYFRITGEGRLFFGSRLGAGREESMHDAEQMLTLAMRRTFPFLADAAVTHAWRGRLWLTDDGLPTCSDEPPILRTFGYNGRGVAMATYGGVEIARRVLEVGSRSSA